jgi:hypothetical protein
MAIKKLVFPANSLKIIKAVKGSRTHLVKKIITNKRGKKQTVWVKPVGKVDVRKKGLKSIELIETEKGKIIDGRKQTEFNFYRSYRKPSEVLTSKEKRLDVALTRVVNLTNKYKIRLSKADNVEWDSDVMQHNLDQVERSCEALEKFTGLPFALGQKLLIRFGADNEFDIEKAHEVKGIATFKPGSVHDPDEKTINIGPNGEGSLAHEWAHFLDYTLAEKIGQPGFISEHAKFYSDPRVTKYVGGKKKLFKRIEENINIKNKQGSKNIVDAIFQFVKITGDSDFGRSSKMYDQIENLERGTGQEYRYAEKPLEMFARAFETYLRDKEKKLPDFLVKSAVKYYQPDKVGIDKNGYQPASKKGGLPKYTHKMPYPQNIERWRLENQFDKILLEMRKMKKVFKALLKALRSRTHLVKKIITNKRGKKQTVWVKPVGKVDVKKPVQRKAEVKIEKKPKDHVVYSKEFKNWFGDWTGGKGSKVVNRLGEPAENYHMSKVLNEKGKPVKVYHGTEKKFNVFDKKKLGKSTHHPTALFGFYFVEDKAVANMFAGNKPEIKKDLSINQYAIQETGKPLVEVPLDDRLPLIKKYEKLEDKVVYEKDPDKAVIESFLNIRNPYEITAEKFKKEFVMPLAEVGMHEKITSKVIKFKKDLIKKGHDGIKIIVDDPDEYDIEYITEFSTNNWIAFEPNQIKSTDAKTFDPKSNNIYKAEKEMDIKNVVIKKLGEPDKNIQLLCKGKSPISLKGKLPTQQEFKDFAKSIFDNNKNIYANGLLKAKPAQVGEVRTHGGIKMKKVGPKNKGFVSKEEGERAAKIAHGKLPNPNKVSKIEKTKFGSYIFWDRSSSDENKHESFEFDTKKEAELARTEYLKTGTYSDPSKKEDKLKPSRKKPDISTKEGKKEAIKTAVKGFIETMSDIFAGRGGAERAAGETQRAGAELGAAGKRAKEQLERAKQAKKQVKVTKKPVEKK